MANENSFYTGKLIYKGIEFSFVFDEKELRLIPPQDKKQEIKYEWLMTPIAKGVYTQCVSLIMENSYLIGQCNENGHKIIFLTRKGSSIGSRNAVLIVSIYAYIDCTLNRDSIDRISFSSPEINCIHPVNQAFSYSFDMNNFNNDGVLTLTTADFQSTTTEKQTFMVDDVEVDVQFSISRKLSTKIGDAPLSLTSCMIFEFKPTNDYEFILTLWYIAKQFIQFLCYRKNISISEVELSAPHENGRHEKFATMHILNECEEIEFDRLKKGCYIQQKYISGMEGRILSDIAASKIYLRHLPETYANGRHIDAARFVMITAAFEWEFHRSYPDGVGKSEATINVEKSASEAIQSLVDSSTGKLKNKYKFLKRLIKSDSLQSEIIQMGKDFDDIVGRFGRHLYKLNDEELDYKEMGSRLADQRNHFAHGDLDKEFIGNSLLDLMYMEYVIYAMQLKFYGIEDDNIKKAINELFNCNFYIE